jgi:hypothetical protein
MKTKTKNSKWLRSLRRKSGLGRYVAGASLLALGAQAQAADTNTIIKPEQAYEGGTNTYNNWVELSAGGLMNTGNGKSAVGGTKQDTGAFGGIQDLHYQTEVAKKTTLTLDGHSIFDTHNYSATVGLVKEDVGYLRFLVENFRTYDSGLGGYVPSDRKAYQSPSGPLSLDRGQFGFEAGLTKPDMPQITLKYNHAYRNGQKSSTEWGPEHDSSGNTYRAYPSILDLDEKTDTLQVDLTHHYNKINYGVGGTYQHGDLTDTHKDTFWQGEPSQQRVTDQQGTTYDMFSAHTFAESWVKNNLFLSGAFMYSDLDDTFSGSRIYGDDFDVPYSPSYPGLSYGYTNLKGNAHAHQYVWNINLLSMPTKTFSITPSIRINKEDWNADSSGTGTLGTDTTPFNSNSGRDDLELTGKLEARYTGVTNWVFSAGGQWTEGQGNYHETGGLTQVNGIGPMPVNYATDDEQFLQKYFLNARWYPARRASLDFGGYYKNNHYDYNHAQDNTPNDGSAGSAYPGFIAFQSFETWDGSVRLTLRPFSKVTTVTRYEYQYSTIHMEPDAGSGFNEQESEKLHSQIIGQTVNWTPLTWLGLQAGANYVLSTTETPVSGYSQSVLNSQNNYLTLNFNSDFVLSEKTDLNIGYFYYHADDFKTPADGLPLGAGAEEHSATATLIHRITQNLRLTLKFAFTHYEDKTNNGLGDYNSYLVSSGLQYRF